MELLVPHIQLGCVTNILLSTTKPPGGSLFIGNLNDMHGSR